MWTSNLVRRGILATTGLQSRNVDNENLLKVGLLRSKLEWLYRTLDDEVGKIRGSLI